MSEYDYNPAPRIVAKKPPLKTVVGHYYGNYVRKEMLAAAIIMLFAALFDKELLQFYLYFGIGLVLLIILLAGLTSPKNRGSIIADTVISAVLFVVFEYFAIGEYIKLGDLNDKTYLLRQVLAIIFLGIIYLGIKTLRGMKTREEETVSN